MLACLFEYKSFRGEERGGKLQKINNTVVVHNRQCDHKSHLLIRSSAPPTKLVYTNIARTAVRHHQHKGHPPAHPPTHPPSSSETPRMYSMNSPSSSALGSPFTTGSTTRYEWKTCVEYFPAPATVFSSFMRVCQVPSWRCASSSSSHAAACCSTKVCVCILFHIKNPSKSLLGSTFYVNVRT